MARLSAATHVTGVKIADRQWFAGCCCGWTASKRFKTEGQARTATDAHVAAERKLAGEYR